MKKILSVLLTVSMLCVMSFAAFAANTIEIESISVNGSILNVQFETSQMDVTDQLTVITYKADSADVAPSESNIEYINQIDRESDNSMQFDLKTAASGIYQVKMGGTDISVPSLMSIAVDNKMSGDTVFVPNDLKLFSQTITTPDKVIDADGNLFILRPGVNYLAAYANAPALEGYTIKECGIRINSENCKANVTVPGAYGMLFHGKELTDNLTVTALPYVTYTKAGSPDITYFGNAVVDTVK